MNSFQIQDTSTSPTLSRLLTAALNKGGSLRSDKSGECGQAADADSLCVEMNDLMHDYEVMSRISDLVVQLKGRYEVIHKSMSLFNFNKYIYKFKYTKIKCQVILIEILEFFNFFLLQL